MKKVGIIVGSLREASFNRAIANTIRDLDVEMEFEMIEIKNLPFFNEDVEAGGDPEAVQTFKKQIEEVDGLLLLTPEYNGGMPGVLKNALDWASRPYGASPIMKKVVGVMGATPGMTGTAYAQIELRNVLEMMQTHVIPFEKVQIATVHEKIDHEKQIVHEEATREQLTAYVQKMEKWIDVFSNQA